MSYRSKNPLSEGRSLNAMYGSRGDKAPKGSEDKEEQPQLGIIKSVKNAYETNEAMVRHGEAIKLTAEFNQVMEDCEKLAKAGQLDQGIMDVIGHIEEKINYYQSVTEGQELDKEGLEIASEQSTDYVKEKLDEIREKLGSKEAEA